jgi:hypothetical protein
MTDEPQAEPVAREAKTETSDPGERLVRDNIQNTIRATIAEAQAIMEGRYKSIALTNLETAELFFLKAIDIDGIK